METTGKHEKSENSSGCDYLTIYIGRIWKSSRNLDYLDLRTIHIYIYQIDVCVESVKCSRDGEV